MRIRFGRPIMGTLCGLVFATTFLAPSIRKPPTARVASPAAPFEVAADKTVLVRPVGGLSERDVDFLARGLTARLGVEVGITPPVEAPWTERDAVDGREIIDWLFLTRPAGVWRTVAVVPDDIAEGDLEEIYGMASTEDSVAVVSMAAFAHDLASSDPYRRADAEDQIIRAATHELAHTMGVAHCPRPSCLMGAITRRSQIGRNTAPCETCALRINAELRRERDPSEEARREGDGYFRRGLYQHALEGYLAAMEQAAEADPAEEASIENRVGAALISMERVAEGEQHVARALELAPDLAPIHYNLALINAYAGNFERSYAALARGMELDPSPLSRHGFAGRFHIEVMEDPTRAISELRAYRRAGGSDRRLLATLEALERRDVVIFEPIEVGVILARPGR